jgi:hypothetical protein
MNSLLKVFVITFSLPSFSLQVLVTVLDALLPWTLTFEFYFQEITFGGISISTGSFKNLSIYYSIGSSSPAFTKPPAKSKQVIFSKSLWTPVKEPNTLNSLLKIFSLWPLSGTPSSMINYEITSSPLSHENERFSP